jgi:RNA polymerase sigma factor (sigma-70 family)
VIRARAQRLLRRFKNRRATCDQVLSDLMQEGFLALFEHDARALARWRPDAGLSLHNWAGLIAERAMSDRLSRDCRRMRGEVMTYDDLPIVEVDIRGELESRAELRRLLRRVEPTLTQRNAQLLHRLLLLGDDVREVANAMGISEAATYAARARLERSLRSLL